MVSARVRERCAKSVSESLARSPCSSVVDGARSDFICKSDLPSGMPPPPSAESSDNKVDYEADDEVDYDGDA